MTPSSPSVDQASSRTQRSSTSLLPPFLADPSRRSRRTSKTRKIIDQLRSASVNGFDGKNCDTIRPIPTLHQRFFADPSISTDESTLELESDTSAPYSFQYPVEDFQEEGDGWLRAEIEDDDDDLEAKARRTRDLVDALGRGRADSTHGSDSDVNHKETDWVLLSQPADNHKKLSKEASSIRRKSSRHRSRKSNGGYRGSSVPSPTAHTSMPLPLTSLPATQPYFPAFPVYSTPYSFAPSAYKSIQIPTQTHCFPAYPSTPFGSITLYPPVISLPSSVSSVNMQGNITGNTGMRHIPW